MKSYFKRKARAFSVSPNEEFLMALGRSYLSPSTNFVGELGASLELTKMLCHETDDFWTLPRLEWRAGAVILGYIQEITVDMHQKTATVGHFAVASDYTGMGFSKRMAHGFAKLLKENYGVTEIIFDERSRKAEYEVFFEHILRAVRVGTAPKHTWRWVWIERWWPVLSFMLSNWQTPLHYS